VDAEHPLPLSPPTTLADLVFYFTVSTQLELGGDPASGEPHHLPLFPPPGLDLCLAARSQKPWLTSQHRRKRLARLGVKVKLANCHKNCKSFIWGLRKLILTLIIAGSGFNVPYTKIRKKKVLEH